MHVLLLPSWYPETPSSSDGQFFRQQAHALQQAGLKTGVVAPLFRSPRRWREIIGGDYGFRRFDDDGLPTYTYGGVYFFPRLPYIDRERWVAAGMRLFGHYLADHGRPDILHAHAVNHGGILADRISRRYGIPYVITEHSSAYARGLIRPWQRKAMLQAAGRASARLAVSREFCRLLEREYGGLDWQYLPNMLGGHFCRPLPLAEQAASDCFTFCSVAHLNRNKGFDILLPAFAAALRRQPCLRLEIGGDGAERGFLEKEVGRLGIGHAVRLSGALDADGVLALMRRSQAFVLASRTETFGVVWIEALSQGLPVIATRCGGAESIVTPENGLLVPTDDVQALTGALLDLYGQRGRYRAAVLRADCLRQFGRSEVVGRLKAMYQNILAAGRDLPIANRPENL